MKIIDCLEDSINQSLCHKAIHSITLDPRTCQRSANLCHKQIIITAFLIIVPKVAKMVQQCL